MVILLSLVTPTTLHNRYLIMANFTDYINGGPVIAASSGGNAAGAPAQSILTGTFDAGKRSLATATVDTAEVINIPAGTLVHNVFVEVLAVNGAGTFHVGDGADPDGFVVSASATALGFVQGAGALIIAAGTFYAAAGKLVVACPVTATDLDSLVVRVVVECTLMG